MLSLKDDFVYQLMPSDITILDCLADGHYLSGEILAQKLGVSRTAIANAIARLRNLGLQIDSVKNIGYRLLFLPTFLDEKVISQYSGAEAYAFTMVDSTNNLALNHIELDDGAVVAADFQNAGRGRRGRRFVSSCGTQALFSYIAKFDSLDKIQGLSVLVGISTARVLAGLGLHQVKIKWPNDIYIGSSKLGGILLETKMHSGQVHTAIGIGLNVDRRIQEHLGNSVGQDYTSMENTISFIINRSELIGKIAHALSVDLSVFKESRLDKFMAEFEQRALYIGEYVNLRSDSLKLNGIFKGILNDGTLLLKTQNKTEKIICGDMSLRPCDCTYSHTYAL